VAQTTTRTGASVKVEVDVRMTAELLARAFCEFDDEEQTRFFVEVGKIMASWPTINREMQFHYIANHLASCECSSDAAREFVLEISRAIGTDTSTH
jgi:hypothetical protein